MRVSSFFKLPLVLLLCVVPIMFLSACGDGNQICINAPNCSIGGGSGSTGETPSTDTPTPTPTIAPTPTMVPTPTMAPTPTPTPQSIDKNLDISFQCSSCVYSEVTATLIHVSDSASSNTTTFTIRLYDGASTNFTNLTYDASLTDASNSYHLNYIQGSYSCTCNGSVDVTIVFSLAAQQSTPYTLDLGVNGVAELENYDGLANSYQTTIAL